MKPDLAHWTPIAIKKRYEKIKENDPLHGWRPIDGVLLSLEQMHELRDAGQILQALRYDEEHAYVVIKRPANSNLVLPLTPSNKRKAA
jgi:hypothetical protein